MYEGELAVAIFSFNRPHYLKQVLHSLSENNLQNTDTYLFQGGTVNKFSGLQHTDKRNIQQSLRVAKNSEIEVEQIYKWRHNLGIGISQYLAKEKIFNDLGYETALFFEDDLVVCRHYIKIIRTLLEQFWEDKNVGTVQATGLNPEHYILSKKEKKQYLRSLYSADMHWWGWATWKRKWNMMKLFFIEYYNLINDIDYSLLNRYKIKQFYMENDFNWGGVGSQDKAMAYSRYKSAMYGLNTVVNRAKNIGKHGTHYTEEAWERQRQHEHKLHCFDEDNHIQSFHERSRWKLFDKQDKLFQNNRNSSKLTAVKLSSLSSIQELLRMFMRSIDVQSVKELLAKGVKLWSKPPR